MSQIDRIHQIRREAQGLLNKSKEEISELLGIGAHEGAVRYFHVTLEAVDAMPPTEWRDWLLVELKKAFPELFKIKPTGVRLDQRPGQSAR